MKYVPQQKVLRLGLRWIVSDKEFHTQQIMY